VADDEINLPDHVTVDVTKHDATLPRWVVFTGMACAVLFVTTIGIVTQWAIQTRSENKEACQKVVDTRADARAVWLYVLEVAEDPGAPRVVAFVNFLNDRLPELRCEGTTPVPLGG
jgi:hypothetical protein